MSLVQATGLAMPGRLKPTALALAPGKLTCLIGPNGSGKTSLLHALARIGGAAGSVHVDGTDVETLGPARRARILTYLPASRDLAWPIAVADLVALSGAEQAEVRRMLARLHLETFARRRADRLSTGERSRALIARAMATGPRLLLLDEPTANLDPLWQIRLMEMLKSDLRDGGRAALVAMHDLDAAGRYADRLIVMRHGAVAADGDPREVLAGPVMARVFGIEQGAEGWRAAVRPAEDR
jgi:iron complex transport system ATP-binding protein